MSNFRPIGLAGRIERGVGMFIPQSGFGGGAEFGAEITDLARAWAITREPAAHRIVCTLAHDIFDNWFDLFLEGKEATDESKTFDTEIQKQLILLHAKREFNKVAEFERAFGWAILAINYTGTTDHSKPLTEKAKGIQEIVAYSPTQISSIKEVKDKKDPRYLQPEVYYIKQRGLASRLQIHWSRTILFNTRPRHDHEWKGRSSLDPVWDDITCLRNIRWSVAQTMYRYGPGFPDLEFTGAEAAKIRKWVDEGQFTNFSARTFFAHNEKQKLEFKGVAGRALDPMNYYLIILESISLGSGIPLAILRGVQAGALTGSEVNQQEYYGLISDEQTAYEDGIRKLINIIIGTLNNEEKTATDQQKKEGKEPPAYSFNWKSGIELTEERKTEIEQKKTQILQMRGGWHTINELRKFEDPKAEDLPDGDVLPGKYGQGDSYLVTEFNKRSKRSESR